MLETNVYVCVNASAFIEQANHKSITVSLDLNSHNSSKTSHFNMCRVSHVNELGVLEKSENFQTFRVCSVAQIMRIPVLKFSKITFWSILRLRNFFLFRRFTGFWVVSVSYKWHHQTRRKRFYRPYKNEPDWRWSILRKYEGKIISLT